MTSLAELWAWLCSPKNRGALAFLGGGLVATAAAAWQIYLHFSPAPLAHPMPTVVSAPSGVAAGVMTVNGDVNLGTGPGTVDPAELKRLKASQEKALNAETQALDDISRQIDAAGGASSAPASGAAAKPGR